MKKTLLAALALTLVFAFTSCKNNRACKLGFSLDKAVTSDHSFAKANGTSGQTAAGLC
jgi:hypothetical protein